MRTVRTVLLLGLALSTWNCGSCQPAKENASTDAGVSGASSSGPVPSSSSSQAASATSAAGSSSTSAGPSSASHATSAAPSSSSGNASSTTGGTYALPADRGTTWAPGVGPLGGIPPRTTACATLQASTFGNGSMDATQGIQAALDACPEGQAVLLSAGEFLINADILYVNKGITLRGAGAGATFLRRTNGAVDAMDTVGAAMPVVIVGSSRWTYGASSVDVTQDVDKGVTSVTVQSAAGLSAGMLVMLDETSGAQWMPDPQGHGRQVWASPDWRTVWQMHLPHVDIIDDNDAADTTGPHDLDGNNMPVRPPASMSWFSRQDRPTSEIHQVASVSGNTVTFTTPVHISYRTTRAAQLTWLGYDAVSAAGVEGVTLTGGDDGALRFVNAVGCWARNVEVATWRGEGIAVDYSFRVEVRDSYLHDAAFSSPGGGAYAISVQGGASEALIENNIVLRSNKVIVSRCSGAGSVVAYNYMDDGFIDYAPAWQEMGVGGSHMAGPHHMLFEGNLSFNGDNDHTHGSSIFHTYFRNHLTGFRSGFTTNTQQAINDLTNVPGPGNGPRRCAGASAFSYWMSFVGNVLGTPGEMGGWTYEASTADDVIWAIGWENHADLFDPDANVAANLLRDGNWDFLTNSVHWHGLGSAGSTPVALPDSLYLASKPAFFGAHPWPWVDPTSGTTHTLPAKARFDNGTPNAP